MDRGKGYQGKYTFIDTLLIFEKNIELDEQNHLFIYLLALS